MELYYSGAYATHKDEALLAQLPLNKSMASFWGHLLHNLVVAFFANVQNMKAIIYLEFFYSIFIFVLLTLNFFSGTINEGYFFYPEGFWQISFWRSVVVVYDTSVMPIVSLDLW